MRVHLLLFVDFLLATAKELMCGNDERFGRGICLKSVESVCRVYRVLASIDSMSATRC